MRKSLLFFFMALLIPVLSFADNMALTKVHTRYSDNTDTLKRETALRVPYKAIVGHEMPAQGTDAYTIGWWFKLDAYCSAGTNTTANKRAVLGRLASPDHLNLNGNWCLSVNTSGQIVLSGHSGDNQNGAGTTGIKIDETLTSPTIALDTWYHLVLNVDNTNNRIALYLNGEKFKEWTTTKPMYYCGTEGWTDGVFSFVDYGYTGKLDELQCWNRGLTDEEVASVYNTNNALSVSDGLAALYTFDTNATTVPNEAPNAAEGTNAVYKLYQAGRWFSDGLTGVNTSWNTDWSEEEASSMSLAEGRELPATEATLSITDAEGGTLSVSDGTNTYTAGTHQVMTRTAFTVTATPADGYVLKQINVTNGSTQLALQSGESFVMAGDATVTAEYTNTLYTLTVDAPEGVNVAITRGTSAVTDLTKLLGETEYTATITIPAGKRLTGVTLGGQALTANANGTYTFTLTADATLAVTVEDIPTCVVTITQPAGGSIAVTYTTGSGTSAVTHTVNSGDRVAEGTVLTLTNTPESGYMFVNYTKDGATFSGTSFTLTANTTISGVFEEGMPEYCKKTGTSGGSNDEYYHPGRYLLGLDVTDGTNSVTLEGQYTTPPTTYATSNHKEIYVDQTSVTLNTTPGATIDVTFKGRCHWASSYVYIDYNRNGQFDLDQTASAANGEWVTYHDGRHSSDSGHGTATSFNLPSFTIPEDIAPGTYRARYVWQDGTDPCGVTKCFAMIDFNIYIEATDLEQERTVTVATENASYGSVAITDPATEGTSVTTNKKAVTVKATPVTGYAFLNWTDASGAVVSTNATYTYTGEADATLTAHFGVAITFSAGNGGSIAVTANGAAITSGAVVAVGSEIVVTTTAEANFKRQSLTVNGESITENPYTFTANESADIVAAFTDAAYTVTVNVTGNGSYEMTYTEDYGTNVTDITSGAGIKIGGWITITALPDDGYKLESASVTGLADGDRTIDDFEDGVLYDVEAGGDVNISLVFVPDATGINGVYADGFDSEKPVEVYNLQGVRVAGENLAPGIYILRQGSKTKKVLVTK